MLQPVNFRDSVLNPERLVAYREELAFSFANGREILRLGDKRLFSASCWWDPSFAAASGDNSVIACVFTDETGHFWLHDLEYIRIEETAADDNIASLQCEKVADFIERNHLPSIRVEANGIGKFLPGILKQTLARRRIKAAVLEVYSSSDKAVRILEAFEVLLAEKALNVHRKSGPRRLLKKCGNGQSKAAFMTTRSMPWPVVWLPNRCASEHIRQKPEISNALAGRELPASLRLRPILICEEKHV